MRRRVRPPVAVAVAVAAAVVLSACSDVEPAPTTGSSSPAAVSSAAVPSPIAALPVPRRLADEVARTVVTEQLNSALSGDLPKDAHRFYLHLRCTGPAGSVMRYRVLHGDGSPFGPSGEWGGDRTTGVIGDQSNRAYVGAVQVRVAIDPGVVTAWAILSTSAAGS